MYIKEGIYDGEHENIEIENNKILSVYSKKWQVRAVSFFNLFMKPRGLSSIIRFDSLSMTKMGCH